MRADGHTDIQRPYPLHTPRLVAYYPGMAEEQEKQPTKGERRERKRRARRKMGVSGKSTRLLLEVLRKRAENEKDKAKNDGASAEAQNRRRENASNDP